MYDLRPNGLDPMIVEACERVSSGTKGEEGA
jgi:hypothetical protein